MFGRKPTWLAPAVCSGRCLGRGPSAPDAAPLVRVLAVSRLWLRSPGRGPDASRLVFRRGPPGQYVVSLSVSRRCLGWCPGSGPAGCEEGELTLHEAWKAIAHSERDIVKWPEELRRDVGVADGAGRSSHLLRTTASALRRVGALTPETCRQLIKLDTAAALIRHICLCSSQVCADRVGYVAQRH